MFHTLRRLALLCCLASGLVSEGAAEVTLTPAQMRELAGQAVLQGQSQLAYDLSGALIERDENDLNAHLIRSRSARDLGRDEDALHHARRAWTLAETQDAQYAAALANAQALSTAGRRTAAQLWLRRAIQLAPTDRLKARAAEDFRYVRGQNRWSTSLQFTLAPSSNINNGSRNETSELFDLPFEFQLEGEARALSGLEIATGFGTRYRLFESERRRITLEFGASYRTYVLSDEARDIAPDAEGSDYATTSLYAGFRETYWLPESRAHLGWNVRAGALWYGGEDLFRYSRLGTSYQKSVGKRGLASASLSHELQVGYNGRDDANIWIGQLGYGMAFENGNRFWISTTLTESESDADFLDYSQRELTLRFSPEQNLGPARLEFGVTVGEKNHDRSDFSADGRTEHSVDASVTAIMYKMDYYGFVPAVTFKAERTDANIELYETESFGVHVGVRSAF